MSKTIEQEAAEFIARLVKLYKRFLQLSPEKQREFLTRISAITQTIEDVELLDMFNEVELIFKADIGE